MDLLTDPQIWISFLTLTTLEIVLGVDNIIFISIVTSRLPQHQQQRGRMIGLGVAMASRILLLLSINWIRTLTEPLFEVFDREITGEGLILLIGGAFLIAKATHELHENLEGPEREEHNVVKVASFGSVIAQIAIIDIVFSIDSVITAVGLAEEVAVMIAAVVVAVIVMMVLAGPISEFVEDHPTLKVLALSFLILIGVSLVAEGLEQHIPKGYVYFAMAFSVLVELLNLRLRSVRKPVQLHHHTPAELEIEGSTAEPGGTAAG